MLEVAGMLPFSNREGIFIYKYNTPQSSHLENIKPPSTSRNAIHHSLPPPPLLLLFRRQNHPVLHPALPIRYPPLLNPHKHNPHLLSFDKAASAPIPLRQRIRPLPSAKKPLLPRRLFVAEGVVLQMPFFAPNFFLASLFEHSSGSVDGGADAAEGARIDVQEKASEAGSCGLRRGRTLACGVRVPGGRTVGNPVVDEDGDAGVSD
ncbi:MAG: hypothetical protein Q9196_007021 [Gyalolechia fulgens]